MPDLGLVLAEVWQGKGRLRVDEMMVDVSLGGHKHQATANAGKKKTLGFRSEHITRYHEENGAL